MNTVKKPEDVRIVIAQRGWVFVGIYHRATRDEVVLTKAQCVRRWGTTRGLGEIAAAGPTKDTVLDPHGTVRLHPLAVVATIQCEATKWAAWLV